MCSFPPMPPLPTSSFDPCSILTGGATSCPITYPNVLGLPVWVVQVAFWALLEIPLTGFGCALNSASAAIAAAFNAFTSGLTSTLLALFTQLGALFSWAGPFAPLLGAFVLGVFVVVVVVVVLFLVDLAKDALELSVDLL